MYLSLNPSERPLKLLKLWICSGETLSKELALKFFQYFGDHDGYKLANFYGSTEVMGDVTFYVLEKSGQLDLHPTIPIGKFSYTKLTYTHTHTHKKNLQKHVTPEASRSECFFNFNNYKTKPL